MILSMTGYGAALHAEHGVSYALELRSVNNRYLKLNVKLPEALAFLEPEVEKLLRKRLSRGTVYFALRLQSTAEPGMRTINVDVLQSYVDRVSKVSVPSDHQAMIDLAAMSALPGVCDVPDLDDEARRRHQQAVMTVTAQVLESLLAMRREEGQALFRDLTETCDAIRAELLNVQSRAPRVIEEYHERLRNRVATLLQASKLELEQDALTREVAIYADRCDIGEEITRLRSHLDQFVQWCEKGEQAGRTLDFLAQELLREANTIGSKSYDADIARSVVQIKGLIGRLKEQVQNVE